MSDLRRRTVRGAAITAAFIVGIDAIVAIQGLIVTRLLGPETIGLYGLVAVTVTTILTLKRVGIDEAFVQQDTDDPETEFQLAAGDLIRLLRKSGFELLDMVEIFAKADAVNHPFYGEYMSVEWAQKWPSEEMWRARKRS